MNRRTLAVAHKEFKHLVRDPRTLLALVVLPALLLLLYGYALSFDVDHVRLGVVDRDGGPAARELVARWTAGETFRLVAFSRDLAALDRLLEASQLQAVLVIPEDFSRKLAQGRTAELQFIVDGSNARVANTVLGYARAWVSTLAPVQFASRGITPAPSVWYNPDLRSSVFLVPGLLAFILMLTTVVATALSVVRELERGTLESLRVTPLSASELILGKTLPYLLLGFLTTGLSLTLAVWLFGVPLRGPLASVAMVVFLFLLGGLGWGLFLSTVAETQQVAFQAALLTTLLPTLLLSGFIFPIASMPKAIQLVTAIVPARYFLVALRGIVLKGATISVFWDQALALLAFAIATLFLATVRLGRKL